jgi:hypothetical protein
MSVGVSGWDHTFTHNDLPKIHRLEEKDKHIQTHVCVGNLLRLFIAVCVCVYVCIWMKMLRLTEWRTAATYRYITYTMMLYSIRPVIADARAVALCDCVYINKYEVVSDTGRPARTYTYIPAMIKM